MQARPVQADFKLFEFLSAFFSTPLMQEAQRLKHAKSHIHFDQFSFIQHVNSIKKKEALESKGICVGYQVVSYAYSCVGLDAEFLQDIQALSSKSSFSAGQEQIIELLDEAQDENHFFNKTTLDTPTQLVTIKNTRELAGMYLSPSTLYSDLREVVSDCIERSVREFGSKVLLILQTDVTAHDVGFQAKRTGDQIILQYDDINFHLNVRFDNFPQALEEISNQLGLRYYLAYLDVWQKGQYPVVYIKSYHAEIDGQPVITPQMAKWAESRRPSFFAPAEQKQGVPSREKKAEINPIQAKRI